MNQQPKKVKVILIGDSCIDEYQYGDVVRLSPEAPVPIVSIKRVEMKNGMASNVADNLTALGVDVIPYLGEPSVKIRVIDDRTKQHILRIDNDIKADALRITTHFSTDIDGIIISDYDKGFVTYELIEHVLSLGVPVFIDTKKTDLRRFEGAFVKINSLEYANAKTLPDNLIVTLGEKGARYNNIHFNAPYVEIADVCGAGDTFLASFSYMYLLSKDIDKSMKFAIKAASITVTHIGVYAPTLEEIK